jgi:RNA polymerase sigma factor (sigma-70 family)
MKTGTRKDTNRLLRPPEEGFEELGRSAIHFKQVTDSSECVPHPSFELSCTEEELFGADAPAVTVNAWASFPELQEDTPGRHQGSSVLRTADEVRLFLQYNYARYRLAQLAQKQRKRASKARAAEMYRWYKKAMSIRNDLTGANLALVIAMAKRTRIPHVDFSELVSEGNMALLRSIEKFDVSRGYKFSTYACRAILKSFNRLASRSGRYYRRFGIEFDESMEPDNHVDDKRKSIQGDALSRLHRILLRNHAELTATEQTVINHRFALTEGSKKKTLAQIGKEMGVSKERIRQIQRSALAKLRRAFRDVSLSA